MSNPDPRYDPENVRTDDHPRAPRAKTPAEEAILRAGRRKFASLQLMKNRHYTPKPSYHKTKAERSASET